MIKIKQCGKMNECFCIFCSFSNCVIPHSYSHEASRGLQLSGDKTACCIALSYLKSSVQTEPEFRAACECLVEGAASIPNLYKDKAIELPKLCNIYVGFPITKDINCGM